MGNFWLGASQGLRSGWEMGSSIAERKRKKEETAAKAKEDLRKWEVLRLEREEAFQFKQQQALEAAGEREEARSLAGMQYETEQTRLDQKAAIDRQVREKAEQQKLEDIRGKLMLTGTPQQQEGLMGIGGVPMRGLEPGMDARTLGPPQRNYKD